ncbi:Uncharacterised protein [Legionella steigerwaltii]|uniref:Uncharacterized protein n=1 Tax=Legionella steigerwaltii TaxID=460 RepID=A0A378LE15_9GAMM|nr:hypothetical protein [Legionella steigerwaltii]KTD78530.1 hypothetical protein Lstg_1265 [Legionella steigerwaltii]STY24112.1 Uncharacterised protein [Legionella steigerwaltii]
MSRARVEPRAPHTLMRAIETNESFVTFNPSLAVSDLEKGGGKNYSLLVEGVPMNPFSQRNVGFLFDGTRSRPVKIFNKDAQTLQGALEGLSLIDPDGKPVITLSQDKFLKEFSTLDELEAWLLKAKDDPDYPRMNNDIVASDIGSGDVVGIFYSNTVAVSNEEFFSDTPVTKSEPEDFLLKALQLQKEVAKQYGKMVPVYEWDCESGLLINRTPTIKLPTSGAGAGITAPRISSEPSVTSSHSLKKALTEMKEERKDKDDRIEPEVITPPSSS